MSDVSAALEAILFSSNRPLKVRELQQATDSDRNSIEGALEHLRETLEGRGVMLMRHHDEVHLATRPEYAPAVRRALRPEVSGRLSQAAYETLAIVAYQQPVTRARTAYLPLMLQPDGWTSSAGNKASRISRSSGVGFWAKRAVSGTGGVGMFGAIV